MKRIYIIVVLALIDCISSKIHTVGPANKDVPESAIAEQPPEQNPGGGKEKKVSFTDYVKKNRLQIQNH